MTEHRLITGKFLRHSPAYYQWRVADREKILSQSPTPEAFDDLAVAHEKLGHHQQAIDLAIEKEKQFPGLYKTRANLGTFYIHAGDLQRGVQEIEAAIAINPDAHFGREEYQKLLVEYVLANRNEDRPGPLQDGRGDFGFAATGFAKYVLDTKQIANASDRKRQTEIEKAAKGILGMMRFGNHESPILLEALGDLLLSRGYPKDAKRLAARAYLKASYGSKDPLVRDAYRDLAKRSLSMQTVASGVPKSLKLETLEKAFRKELAAGEAWFEKVEADEKKWIQSGINVDEAFSKKYYRTPRVAMRLTPWTLLSPTYLVAIAILAFMASAVQRWRRKASTQ